MCVYKLLQLWKSGLYSLAYSLNQLVGSVRTLPRNLQVHKQRVMTWVVISKLSYLVPKSKYIFRQIWHMLGLFTGSVLILSRNLQICRWAYICNMYGYLQAMFLSFLGIFKYIGEQILHMMGYSRYIGFTLEVYTEVRPELWFSI